LYKLVLFCALSSSAALALPGTDEKVYSMSDSGVTAPVLAFKVEPKYTQDARDAKIEGPVMLQAEISSEGIPDKIAITRGLEPGLDQNAIEAVKSWRFRPGMKDGQPVRVKATIEVNFRLK
jgi:TonB family protein